MQRAEVQIGKLWATAIGWKDKQLNRWREKRRHLVNKKQPHDAELWAISDALEIAIKETKNTNATSVTVFADSIAAVAKIQKKDAKFEGRTIKDLVYQRAKELKKNRHSLVFRWAPGH